MPSNGTRTGRTGCGASSANRPKQSDSRSNAATSRGSVGSPNSGWYDARRYVAARRYASRALTR
nr:hypothetical protein GCM10020092_072240 [Actinoplanes digitatis]